MSNRKSRTAAEFIAELQGDAEYQAHRREQPERTDRHRVECDEDERALVAELGRVLPAINSVWDFVAAGGAPPPAVPILVRHLGIPHHPRIWDGIVRALSVKHARDVALAPLCRLYEEEAEASRRWVIANAIGSMARFKAVSTLPNIEQYRALFRQTRKPPHVPPAI